MPSNIFVQFLAGPVDLRAGVNGLLLQAIAWISLVIGPMLLLVLFILQFLPYHSESALWWQRMLVVADLVLLWQLWPEVVQIEKIDNKRQGASKWMMECPVLIARLASAVLLLFVFTVATFPTEWLHSSIPYARIIPIEVPPHYDISRSEGLHLEPSRTKWFSVQELLMGSDVVDDVVLKPSGLFSKRLVMPRIDTINGDSPNSPVLQKTISLRDRRLEGAILTSANLTKADLTGAHLQGADLNGADLRGVLLANAQLQGATLIRANMQGADLWRAQLVGAWLSEARMQGAILWGAQLQGAQLNRTQVQGATLDRAQLQGANLTGAQLQGATFVLSELQGTVLDEAQLEDATLDRVFAWRSDARGALGERSRVIAPETTPKYRGLDCSPAQKDPCSWSANTFAMLKLSIEKQVADDTRRLVALKGIAVLDPERPQQDESGTFWANLARSSPSGDVYEKGLGLRWSEIGCNRTEAPYVIQALLFHFRSISREGPRPVLALDDFLNVAKCPGARYLSEESKEKLREMRAQINGKNERREYVKEPASSID
jgi:uncharacterized protein YjbI with pentapeptide repeats